MPVRRPGRIVLVVVLSCAVVGELGGGAAVGAAGDSERIRDARAHYEKGVSHYNLDEFAAALAEFTEAYRLKPDASFLFNIAQCHRRLGNTDAAADYYRKYLRNVPDARNRAEVERMIAELRAQNPAPPIGDQPPAAAPGTPEAAPPPERTPETPAVPAAVLPTPAPAPEPTVALSTAAAAEPQTPLYRHWWFWGAVGAIAAGVVVTAVVLSASGGKDDPYAGSFGVTRVP